MHALLKSACDSRCLLAAKLGMVWPQALLEEENKELRQARRTVGMSRHHKVLRFSEVAISRNCLYPVVGAFWI